MRATSCSASTRAVLLRPPRVLAGLGVADFGQATAATAPSGAATAVLLAAGPVRAPALDVNRATVIAASAPISPTSERAATGTCRSSTAASRHPHHTAPRQHRHGDACPSARPISPTSSADDEAEPEDELRLDATPCSGRRDEVLLQQIVGDGGLNFDAGKQRVERRRHHFARAERRGPDEHDLVLEASPASPGRRARRPPRRTETSLRAAIAQQQIALAVERTLRSGRSSVERARC